MGEIFSKRGDIVATEPGCNVAHHVERIIAAGAILPGGKLIAGVTRGLPGEVREAGRDAGPGLSVTIDAGRHVFLGGADRGQDTASLNEPAVARRGWYEGCRGRGVITGDVLHVL